MSMSRHIGHKKKAAICSRHSKNPTTDNMHGKIDGGYARSVQWRNSSAKRAQQESGIVLRDGGNTQLAHQKSSNAEQA